MGLNIWKNELLASLKICDPRNMQTRILHFYLIYSQKLSNSILIKFIDKLLKMIGF